MADGTNKDLAKSYLIDLVPYVTKGMFTVSQLEALFCAVVFATSRGVNIDVLTGGIYKLGEKTGDKPC